MMRKLFVVLCVLFLHSVRADQVVNVEYIHKLIKDRHGIDIEYSTELSDPTVAANMKYLLSMVDIANMRLNNAQITNYGENEQYASLAAADTVATEYAVNNLIIKVNTDVEYPFHFRPSGISTTYSFSISAIGTFNIDWGDGNTQTVTKTNTNAQTVSHTYSNAANTYTIGLGGSATGYNTGTVAAISFNATASHVAEIDGCLGCVFGTIGDGANAGQQPRFYYTFNNNTDLTGSIPGILFFGINGAPATYMFHNTFRNTGLTGPIPGSLFMGISGAPADYMFHGTFELCGGLTHVPENLFAGISSTASAADFMFKGTFSKCTGLTGGSSPKIGGKFLYEIWPMTSSVPQYTYYDCSGLTDFADIPAIWGQGT